MKVSPTMTLRTCGIRRFSIPVPLLLTLLTLLTLLAPFRPAYADPPGRVKLVVWGLQSGKESAGLDAQVAEFMKRNPDIEVSLLSMGAGNMNPQKLMTSIVGRVPPDVIHQDRFTIGDWASRDTFMPLDDFLARESGDDAVRAADFYPAAWNEAVYKEKVYAIPTGIDDRLLFYNRTIFKEAGLNPDRPPQTWEELEEYARKLTQYNSDGTFARIGFIPNYGNSWLYIYSWQNGGEFMSPDRTQCTLAAPENVGALDYMVRMYDALGGFDKVNIFQSGFQGGEQDPFFLGKVAMVTNGSWVLNNIARYAPDLDFAVAPAPVPKERLEGKGRFAGQDRFITWIGGYSFAIPSGARNPEAAWKFIRWMSSVECALIGAKAQKAYSEKKGRPFVFNLSANLRVNAALLEQVPPVSPRLKEAQRAFIDMLPYAKYRPVTFVGQKLWDAHVRAFDRAVAHAQTPKAALEEQQKLVQEELDKAYAREKLPLFNYTVPVAVLAVLGLGGLIYGVFRASRSVGRSRMARSEAIAGYLMAMPWIFGFLLLTAGPILASILFAFCDYDVLHAPRYVGLYNFRTLFTDDRELISKALGNAAYLSLVGIPLGMSTGLAIAMLLNTKVKGMNAYRTAFYLPSIVPAIASAALWAWVLAGDPNKGLLNALWKTTLTAWFHLDPPGWFGSPDWAKPGLIVQGLWGAGGGMILWLAGLQGIPQNLYEAAEIDGASVFARFRHVTLPMLSPYIFFNLIMGTIGALQEFDRVYVLGDGNGGAGPLDSMLVPVLYLFNNAFRYFKMGYASAIAWVIFIIILALTLTQWTLQKYWVHYETDKR
ncbi:MAG: extracellular solute-binding protein [Capsulimonadales bacterium]|nr:extracellular solute-binding protein [Capsulimonadales bacterium]